jgi:hypothetical protein
MKNIIELTFFFCLLLLYSCTTKNNTDPYKGNSNSLYEYQNMETRWSSFENITSSKGKGGAENNGAKGHACNDVKAGESITLLNVEGPGVINRMWFTIDDRTPEMLRSLKIEMFWDGASKPAVAAPFGDFFGIGLGRKTPFENELFADPEGRSFNCFIQMPFKKSAKVVITNESAKDLNMLFYDINLVKLEQWNDNNLYFHCYWHRDTATTLGKDFEILPRVTGKGRFLGSNIGVNANPRYKDHWWGEGEVKIYVDGDTDLATLVGSGTEDYIGTAWGQGNFCTRYTGCLVSDKAKKQWAFFRYHIVDPIFFKADLKATIQQIGGNEKSKVLALQKEGVPLLPITIHELPKMHQLYDPAQPLDLTRKDLPEGWTNYYRSDDFSATAYFYLDKPENDLPLLQAVNVRTAKL